MTEILIYFQVRIFSRLKPIKERVIEWVNEIIPLTAADLYFSFPISRLKYNIIAFIAHNYSKRKLIDYQPRYRRKRNFRFGFTLVEILVAITVLTLGILTVSQLTLIGLRANSVNKQRIYGRVAMTRVFENLNNRPSTDSLLIDDSDPTDLNDTGATADYSRVIEDAVANYRYLARWNIADNTPEPNLKTVRIHILWGNNNRHHITSDLIKRM